MQTEDQSDEIMLKLDQIEHDVQRARRAAETTRTIAIVAIAFFVGLPLVVMIFNIIRFSVL